MKVFIRHLMTDYEKFIGDLPPSEIPGLVNIFEKFSVSGNDDDRQWVYFNSEYDLKENRFLILMDYLE